MFSNILGGAAGFPVADLGDTISQSLRFPSSTGPSLSRTMGTGDSRRKFTISVWVKRGKIPSGDQNHIWNYEDNPNVCALGFNENKLRFYHYDSGGTFNAQYVSTAVFRDTSAWYHIVAAVDTTLATATDRVKLWVNGARVTSFGTQTTFSQNYDTHVGVNNYTALIGKYADGSSFKFGGYVANKYFLDGITASETDFGRYQEDGVWVPKNYSGSYGTNGYKLDFADSSDLGNDVSGNNNDFTATGFDTTAISSSNFDNDVDFNDTPTSNWTTLNSVDVSGVGNLSAANLSCGTTSAADTSGIRATQAVSSGKWYFEVKNTVASGTTNIQAGWASTATAQRIDTGDANVYGMPITTNSTHMVALDCDNNAIWTGDDGVWFNSATLSEIEGGDTSNARHTSVSGYPLAPMFLDQAGSFSGTASFNFGQMDFQYTPPAGFSPLHLNNLPEPTIKNGKEHFNILTWTGTGTTNALTGLGFQPDLVWVKKRGDTTESHDLQDSIRGAGERLRTNSPDISRTIAGTIDSFDSDGFTVDDAGTTNESGKTYVAWCWKAGGTAVSNTDGSTTSTVSANTDAGFSIVKYTGTSANATVGHGLNSPPECIIFKDYTDLNEENWAIWFNGFNVSTGEHLAFNTSGLDTLSTLLNGTAPTSSVIHLGNNVLINDNGEDVIAYCWHSVEGYSKIGSFSGNANADGSFIYLGFRPAFFLWKRTDSTGTWGMIDSTRNTHNPLGQQLFPNTNDAEATYTICDFLSNGIKMRNSFGDTNTGTIAFLAFAENPFGGENAPPVTAR